MIRWPVLDQKPIPTALVVTLLLALSPTVLMSQQNQRPRARELGMEIGVFPTGLNNASQIAHWPPDLPLGPTARS